MDGSVATRADAAQALHDGGSEAAGRAGAADAAGVAVLTLGGPPGGRVGVAGAAAADVAEGLLLDLALHLVLLLEGHDGARGLGPGVAGAAAARVEAAGAGLGGDGLGGDARRRRGLGGAEEVAGAAPSRVEVRVLRNRGVRLVDSQAGHLDGCEGAPTGG